MKTVLLSNLVWKEGRYFVAQCLNFEVSSFGDTKDDALANLQGALALYFEDNHHSCAAIIERPELVSFTPKDN